MANDNNTLCLIVSSEADATFKTNLVCQTSFKRAVHCGDQC